MVSRTKCEKRQMSKPLMERRRRERINKSLNELKLILLEALRRDNADHAKLEKAAILEMTVRYLRSIKSTHDMYPAPKLSVMPESTASRRPLPTLGHMLRRYQQMQCCHDAASISKQTQTVGRDSSFRLKKQSTSDEIFRPYRL